MEHRKLLNCDLNIRSPIGLNVAQAKKLAYPAARLVGGNLKSILGYANAYCSGITLAAGESLSLSLSAGLKRRRINFPPSAAPFPKIKTNPRPVDHSFRSSTSENFIEQLNPFHYSTSAFVILQMHQFSKFF